jgi:DNA-binding response OmpR family regulator
MVIPHRMVAADDVFDSEPPTAGRRPRIVVADDDDDARALLVAMFRLDGYEVIEARDGDAVIRLMREATRMPDAIVTDVCMPTVSGLSVLAALRADGWQTPVILLTALGAERVGAEAKQLGADVVIGKPFDTHDLRKVVMNVLWPMTTLA